MDLTVSFFAKEHERMASVEWGTLGYKYGHVAEDLLGEFDRHSVLEDHLDREFAWESKIHIS